MYPLKSDEYPAVYNIYIEKVNGDVMEELENQLDSFTEFILSMSEEKTNYSYEEGKWTVKEVLCHIIDTERIMSYRALRFARNDMTALADFEQDDFVANATHNERSLVSIAQEFEYVRKSNICFFNTLSPKELERKGMAAERLISVRALIYLLVGHLNHHVAILKDKYLKTE